MKHYKDPMFLRQIIMDHYEYPRNQECGNKENYHHVRMKSDSCIDDLSFKFLIKDRRIVDLCFDGQACAIATASASIMTELIKGKTLQEALLIKEEFEKMLRLEAYSEEILKEANAFRSVGKQANRIMCAKLSWDGFSQIVKEVIDHDNEG